MQSYTLSNGMHYVKRKNKNVTQFKRREIKKLDKKCDEPEINARKNFFAALTSAPALYGQLLHYHNHLNITITLPTMTVAGEIEILIFSTNFQRKQLKRLATDSVHVF